MFYKYVSTTIVCFGLSMIPISLVSASNIEFDITSPKATLEYETDNNISSNTPQVTLHSEKFSSNKKLELPFENYNQKDSLTDILSSLPPYLLDYSRKHFRVPVFPSSGIDSPLNDENSDRSNHNNEQDDTYEHEQKRHIKLSKKLELATIRKTNIDTDYCDCTLLGDIFQGLSGTVFFSENNQ